MSHNSSVELHTFTLMHLSVHALVHLPTLTPCTHILWHTPTRIHTPSTSTGAQTYTHIHTQQSCTHTQTSSHRQQTFTDTPVATFTADPKVCFNSEIWLGSLTDRSLHAYIDGTTYHTIAIWILLCSLSPSLFWLNNCERSEKKREEIFTSGKDE